MAGTLESFEEADLCVIAIPIEGISAVVKELADNHSLLNYDLITDVASNKRSLLEAIDKLKYDSKRAFLSKFISSHPLAGSEQGDGRVLLLTCSKNCLFVRYAWNTFWERS